MYPNLFTLPGLGWEIKSYGLMMMLAFLVGIYLAVRRAIRVHADPDILINMGFTSLVGGLGGSRLFYVVHYWDESFGIHWVQGQPFWTNLVNTAGAVLDVRNGGLEFLGGFIGGVGLTMLYLLLKRVSLRWYLDIIAPSVMFGAMLGRIGCFLNGCCWGKTCATGAASVIALSFPFGSNPSLTQFNSLELTAPPELTWVWNFQPQIVNQESLKFTQADVDAFLAEEAKLSPAARIEHSQRRPELTLLAQQVARTGQTVDQLKALAAQYPSKPVYPTQLLSAFSAFTLWLLAEAVFRWRRRHGTVLIMVFMLYPINRYLEEILRQDNPLDTFGLTVSQAVSLGLFVVGLVWLIVTIKLLPAISPKVRPVTFA